MRGYIVSRNHTSFDLHFPWETRNNKGVKSLTSALMHKPAGVYYQGRIHRFLLASLAWRPKAVQDAFAGANRTGFSTIKIKPFVVLASALVFAITFVPALSASPTAASSPNVVVTNPPATTMQIVTCNQGVDLDGMVVELGVTTRFIYRHALYGFAAPLDSAAIATLKHDSRVLAIEADGRIAPGYIQFPQVIPTGVWRIGDSNFPVAHINEHYHSLNVDVAEIDTGVDLYHPDIQVYQVAGFADAGPNNGQDENGHGTFVAGILCALDNTNGVVGVAPGVRLWDVQVFGPGENTAPWSSIIAACDYIFTNADKISVVNASLAGSDNPSVSGVPYSAIHTAVSNLVSVGIVFVAAAGNSAQDIIGPDGIWGVNPSNGICDDFLPAALPEVMAVSAMDPITNVIANFSNFSATNKVPRYVISPGLGIDVAGPGVNILSTYLSSGAGFFEMSGTSASSPHVAGLVALYIAANGRATNAAGVYAIRQAIVNSGQPQSQWGVTNTMDPDGNPEPLAVASTNWVPNPNITNLTKTGTVQLGFAAVPGYEYTAQYKNSLASSNGWSNLPNVVTGTYGVSNAMIIDASPSPSTRYYRLVRSPAP